MSKHWEKAIAKTETGEVGRVYFINTMMISSKGDLKETNNHPFTLNPDHGSTIERMLRMSCDLPGPIKSELLSHRTCEVKLTGGAIMRIWIAEEAAPDTQKLRQEDLEREHRRRLKEMSERPVLYNLDGSRMN